MTTSQKNRQQMGLSVLQVLKNYESDWTSNPVFSAAFATHESNLNGITQAEVNQLLREEIKGITFSKSILRSLLISSLGRCVAAVKAYAVSINDPALAASVNFSPSVLDRISDQAFFNAASHIYEVTNDHILALAPYTITPAFLATLQGDISAFLAIYPKPKAMRAQVKAFTNDIKIAVNKMTSFLSHTMDNLVRSIFPDTPFQAAYFNSRVVYNYNEHVTGIKGTVRNFETGRAISNVIIELVNYPVPGDITVRSSNHIGNYHFKHLTPGNVSMRVRANGFTTSEFTVKVVKNQLKDFDILILPEPVPDPVPA